MYPSQCSLHALPGLQRKTRHAAGKCSQLRKGRIQKLKNQVGFRFFFFVGLNCREDLDVCKPKIIPPGEFPFIVAWGGAGGGCSRSSVLVHRTPNLQPKEMCFRLFPQPREVPQPCRPQPFPALWTAAPNPQPSPHSPTPPQLLSEDIEKEKGPGLMCN